MRKQLDSPPGPRAPRSAALRNLRTVGSLAFTAFREWVRDRCEGLAAAIAFNALLAIAPLITLILVLAGTFLGQEWAQENVLPVLLAWIGQRGTAVLQVLLLEREGFDPSALVSLSIVAAVSLTVGASGFFLQIQDALETVWNVRREDPRFRAQMRKRLLALVYALLSALIIFAGMAAAGVILAVSRSEPGHGELGVLRFLGEALVAFLTFWALVSFWLKALPPVTLTWRQILPWAALIALIHLLARLVVTWSAARQSADSSLQVAASFILVILWYHFVFMVFLYGAQLMRVCLIRYGDVKLPEPTEGSASS